MDIIKLAKENGAFKSYFPDDLQYIGDNVNEFNDITFHELLFMDMFGFVDTWSFKVDNSTGKIVPYEGGFNFMIDGFRPEEMRKKLAMVDKAKAKAARENRTA